MLKIVADVNNGVLEVEAQGTPNELLSEATHIAAAVINSVCNEVPDTKDRIQVSSDIYHSFCSELGAQLASRVADTLRQECGNDLSKITELLGTLHQLLSDKEEK